MKLFLDTTNSGICVAIFDKNFGVLGHKIINNLKEKAEKLPSLFEQLLESLNIWVFEISEYFLCIGPGSFTGSRVGVIFIRTIAQITKAKISTINSFELCALTNQKKEGEIVIKISASSALRGKIKNFKLIEIQPQRQTQELQECNYKFLIENFGFVSNYFESHKNPLDIEVFYGAQPQIGITK